MRFEILGPMRVLRGAEVTTVSGSLRRSLLAVLVARANQPVPVETLLDSLWGEQPNSGLERRLHLHVHKLRGLLGEPGRVSFSPGGYALTVLPGELDADEFDTLVDEATSVGEQEPLRCAELLRKALGLFRGEPYQGVDVLELAGEVQRYGERRLVAMEGLYAAELRCGRHAEVVGDLSELVHQHPLRERFHALVMTALYRSGRQADALAVYQQARGALIEELGLEPGPQLRELERRVLSGESIPTDAEAQHAPVPRTPAQLPTAPTGFVGREYELAALEAGLSPESRARTDAGAVAVVAGTGGVGKTALALTWAHRARNRFPDGQLYVDLGGYGPDLAVPPEDALAGFLRALGLDGGAIPQELSERSARLRSSLAETKTLLVLDNARTVDQVRPLLPATPGCAVVITSRDPLAGLVARDGADRVELEQLTDPEAHQLLRDLLGSDRVGADPAGVSRLIARCARLPLAIRIAAERIRFRPGAVIGELVDELDNPRDRLDLLEISDDPYSSVRAVLSWSYRQLPQQAAELFRLWGLHTGHDIDTDALAALTGREARSTRRTIGVLQRAHLVNEPSPGRYVLHDLLRAYAAELAQEVDDETARQQARSRIFDHYLSTAARAMERVVPEESELRPERASEAMAVPEFSSYEGARRWLDTERPNLVHVADQAPEHGVPLYTTDLSAALSPYLDIGWYHDDALRIHTRALEVAQQHDDQAAEGIALRSLGIRLFRLNRYVDSTAVLERATGVQQERGEGQSLATTLNYLAGAYQVLGRSDEAITQYHRTLELYRRLGLSSLTDKPLSNLGHLYRSQGEYAEAEQCFVLALSIAEEADHLPGTAFALMHLAFLGHDTARYYDALDYAHRARRLVRMNGMPALDVLVLDVIGMVNLRLGNVQQAIDYHQKALTLTRPDGDRALTARIMNGLAEAQAANGDPDEACDHFRGVLTIGSVGIDVATRRERARAHRGLGDAHSALGQDAEAAEHWRKAQEIYRALSAPEADEVAARLAASCH